MYSTLKQNCERLSECFTEISAEHLSVLDQLAAICLQYHTPQLIFVCTHNSRRSLLAQAWAAAAADFYGINLQSFSGGTEVTSLNSHAIDALRKQGFDVTRRSTETNAHYMVRFDAKSNAYIDGFSKMYGDAPNPTDKFVAVMMCEDAMEKCPVVHGAAGRFSLPFSDPKRADGTPAQAQAYAQTAEAIAIEMLYLAKQLAKRSA